MSTVGMMEGAFFVSRSELLSWANSFFQLSLTKVEQCSNGCVYCHVIDACHPGTVAMKKLNWSARAEHECIPNYKVLQQALDKNQIQRHIEVDKLIRGKYQDNLEMLQWIKAYFDRNFGGGEYDALSRRFADTLPEWARAPGEPASAPSRPSAGGGSRPSSGAGPKGAHRGAGSAAAAALQRPGAAGRRGGPASQAEIGERLKEEHEKLREEVVDLKITVDGLETERDFYFQKLRDIEILCQALEENPDPNMTVPKFVEDVQRILYAKEEDEEEGNTEQVPKAEL